MGDTNLGVKPLGRGEQASAVVLAEVAALKAFGEELRSLMPINTSEKAKAYRGLYIRYIEANELAKGDKGATARATAKVERFQGIFRACGYDY